MTLEEIYLRFIGGMPKTGLVEYIAVFAGIASVWFSRKESILTYPAGLINTTFYIYLSIRTDLPGEASVNLYYTVMSIYGWYIWMKKDSRDQKILQIAYSNRRMQLHQLLFFLVFYVVLFGALSLLKTKFFPGAMPWADAFASATAFTGMWLMTRKKVESWYWWILTNASSIPLYFVKGLIFTSVYYLVLLLFAFWGLAEWRRRAGKGRQ